MNSFTTSRPPSISDLDGYTIRDYHCYVPNDGDDFGFDPPEHGNSHPKMEQTYSPPEDTDSPLADWPGFEREDERRHQPLLEQMHNLHQMAAQRIPNANHAISRYGQITPPRTNSTGSGASPKVEESMSPLSAVPRRKSTKQTNDTAPTSGRKRKATRKSTAASEGLTGDDGKRKASLEKNRLAAAKCRVNKKDKTEQLQRDSHDKAVHNAYLKEQIMRMKEEVQQLNALLLAHASSSNCESPEEIQKHLQDLSAEYMPNQVSIGGFPDYDDMSLDGMPNVSQSMTDGGYFSVAPPLPEFNRSADFEVHTPMHGG